MHSPKFRADHALSARSGRQCEPNAEYALDDCLRTVQPGAFISAGSGMPPRTVRCTRHCRGCGRRAGSLSCMGHRSPSNHRHHELSAVCTCADMLVPESRGSEAGGAVLGRRHRVRGRARPGFGCGGHRGSSVAAPVRSRMCAGLKNSGTGRAPANMLANWSMAFWLPAIAASSCCISGGGGAARSAS